MPAAISTVSCRSVATATVTATLQTAIAASAMTGNNRSRRIAGPSEAWKQPRPCLWRHRRGSRRRLAIRIGIGLPPPLALFLRVARAPLGPQIGAPTGAVTLGIEGIHPIHLTHHHILPRAIWKQRRGARMGAP